MNLSEITSLQVTLNGALDAYKAELAAHGLSEPSLRTSRSHPTDEAGYIPSPALFEARRTALASMGLIKSLIQPPYHALMSNSMMACEPVALRVAAELGIATILGDSEDGLTIDEISERADVDASKLVRVLRLLVTQGWFREPRENVFANNRYSNIIKKGQPGCDQASYMNPLGHKMTLNLLEMINHSDPEFKRSTDPSHTAFQLSHNTNLHYFGAGGWLSMHPEDAVGFAKGMGAIGPTSDAGVAADYPWSETARNKDAVVDLGGGQGTLSCSLAVKYPEIQSFIVQDLPVTRKAAQSFINSRGLTERVKFEEHNFFEPQKRKGKYVYVIQRVLHDWNKSDCLRILGHIRDVLNEDSCLLIIETIIEHGVVSPVAAHATAAESLSNANSKNVYERIPPPDLFPNDFGDASRIPHQLSLILTTLCNSSERTLSQYTELYDLAGLKIKKVYNTRGWMSITEVVIK